jgi:hypothetical protein
MGNTSTSAVGKMDMDSFLKLKRENATSKDKSIMFKLLQIGIQHINRMRKILNVHNRLTFRLLHDDILDEIEYELYLQYKIIISSISFNVFEFIKFKEEDIYDLTDICVVIDKIFKYISLKKPIKIKLDELKILYYFLPKNKVYELCFVDCLNKVLNHSYLE